MSTPSIIIASYVICTIGILGYFGWLLYSNSSLKYRKATKMANLRLISKEVCSIEKYLRGYYRSKYNEEALKGWIEDSPCRLLILLVERPDGQNEPFSAPIVPILVNGYQAARDDIVNGERPTIDTLIKLQEVFTILHGEILAGKRRYD